MMPALVMRRLGVVGVTVVPVTVLPGGVYAHAEGGALPLQEDRYPEDREEAPHAGSIAASAMGGADRGTGQADPPSGRMSGVYGDHDRPTAQGVYLPT